MSDLKYKAIYGTHDILPDQTPIWNKILSTVSKLASQYGFGFIHPPIFEATELFTRGIGETSDIVSKEMYTFTDQGRRSLTLRPEGTAPVVRAYLEHSMAARHGLAKVWYAGPMFRQERPQAGRLRQFYQFGVEAIGSLNPALDAEVIDLNHRILSSLGVQSLRLHINSIGMAEDRQAHRKAFADFVTPNIAKFCPACQKRFQTNPLRMFDCKEESCRKLLEGAPVVLDYLSSENRAHFEKVQEYLSSIGLDFVVDTKLVRGLDYYTRTAWEIKSVKLGSQDSLSGGGRYDMLVEQLGGPPTPGVGFAAGFERIVMAMPNQANLAQSDSPGAFIVTSGEQYQTIAFQVANNLRRSGLGADLDFLGRSVKAQMKQAGKSGLSHAIILAQEEVSKGRAILRNLKSSEQIEVDLAGLRDAHLNRNLGELFGRNQES
jgi:histidyl-tRNA synthetase